MGAGVGMGVTLVYELMNRNATGGDETGKKTLKYRNILEDSELNVIVDDLNSFRDVSPPAFEKLLQDLDKFSGIVTLILSFSSPKKRNGEEFDAGWSITATHHNESVRESLSALEFSVSDSMTADFAEKKKELIQYLDNSLYNVNMHTQTILDA